MPSLLSTTSLTALSTHALLALGAPGSPSHTNNHNDITSTTTTLLSTIHASTLQASTSNNSTITTASTSPPQPTGPASAALQSCAARLNGQLPTPTPPDFHFSGTVRRYYIAAEEELWNYAPTGWDNWLGVPIDLSPRYQALNPLSSTWLKALYRGYTDETFTLRSEQPPWQGTQGPTIRSEVGDLIEILFLNNLTKNFATMHSMGLEYTKVDGEGADYPNNTMPGVNVTLPEGGAVPPTNGNPGIAPGGCVVYKWMVDAAAGPNDGAPSRAHSYHSYVALEQDTNAGLIGPSIVYAPGQMNATMSHYREFPLLYMIYDEATSWLSGENRALLGSNSNKNSTTNYAAAVNDFGGPSNYGSPGSANATGAGSFGITSTELQTLWSGNQSVWQPQLVNLAGSGQFPSAPSFYTMNGYIFANNPAYEMCLSDDVIWYVNAYGQASHVFHMHGNGFVWEGNKRYAVGLNDGEGKALFMNATDAGKWQVICHVNNHHTLGMVSDYLVYFGGECPLEKKVE